jgi:hypothetical protein
MKLFRGNLVFAYFEDFDNIQLISTLIEYISKSIISIQRMNRISNH